MNNIKMEAIDIREYLFHAIRPYKHKGVGDEETKAEIKILIDILTAGAIFSRRRLKEILTDERYNELVEGHRVNWNRLDWISLAATTDTTINFMDDGFIVPYSKMDDGIPAFDEHVKEYPSIILNPNLLNDLVIADYYSDEYYGGQMCEVQVKDKITNDYFVGIALPNIYESFNLMKDYISPSSNDYYLYEELKHLDAEEFLNKYYKSAILFENALNNINCNLPIFHTESGNPILPYQQELEMITKVKKKIR